MQGRKIHSENVGLAAMFRPESSNRRNLDIAHQALQTIIAEELTPRQREILMMRYYDQKNVAQIAAALHVNPSTVSRTLRRAEERVRKYMRFYLDYRNAVLTEEDD